MGRRHRILISIAGVVIVALAGCDIRPLTHGELFGARDAATPDTPPDVVTQPPPDGNSPGDSPPGDTPSRCVPADCAFDQYCDEISGRCASRFGAGMLSGVVRDACSGEALDARVGIAGQRQCSPTGKGNYFFSNLPLGTLKLAAFKVGYRPYDATIVIDRGGTIQDIVLDRDTPGGCSDPRPATAACTCTEPGCP